MEKDVEQFLSAVLQFAEASDGHEGLQRMTTVEGMIDYMKQYLAANEKTWMKYLSSSSEVQEEIKQSIMVSVYARLTKQKE